jgi:hypothetical protein
MHWRARNGGPKLGHVQAQTSLWEVVQSLQVSLWKAVLSLDEAREEINLGLPKDIIRQKKHLGGLKEIASRNDGSTSCKPWWG